MKEDSEKDFGLSNTATQTPLSSGKINEFVELDIKAMVNGIGRKATDEELTNYFSKGINSDCIDIETAFSKYLTEK